MRYLGLLCLLVIALATSVANAQDNAILARGDAVVTGFSGTTKGASPDEIFIDSNGASARIFKLEPGASPASQLLAAPPFFAVKASDVGQVFAIGLDDGLLPPTAKATPNIYLGATSAFGLQIVSPDSNGDGRPKRARKGRANAQWMAGQLGKDGEPGSIYKVDGRTGTVSLFATIPGNHGPGLGDIVFDSATRQFFVSDLDTGLIHRLDAAGQLIDSFDHGETGRPAMGLAAIADDGAAMDITSPAFDSEDAASWGFTQAERRVWGLGLNAGRLYYAVAQGPEIWSVSINLDGTFGNDPRREIEVSGTPDNHPISDIAFDAGNHMYVAQRGGIKGSYDYSIFADARQSVVFRFMREAPDDPVTPGLWVPIPDEYAIGYPPDHRNTSGGIALGYGYGRTGACDMTIWTTGDALLSKVSPMQEAAAQPSSAVNGLQGNDRQLTRPDNEPPAASYFIDYDGVTDDPESQGHVGDVEIWQPCASGTDFGTYDPAADLPPDYVPGVTPEDGVPPDGTPGLTYNLRLEKRSVPGACVAGGLGFLCDYVVRVTNTGPDAYIGPITVSERLPAAPAGAIMTMANTPPWICFAVSPAEQQCTYGPTALMPGESVDLNVMVDLSVAAPVCHLDNQAALQWPWGGGDIDPTDDFDLATAVIPAAHCPPPAGEKTNLKISKHPFADVCADKGGFFECRYNVVVRNMGPGLYSGPVKVEDTIPAGATASFPQASWNCTGPAPSYSCERGPVALLPGQAVNLNAVVKVPKNLAGALSCKAENKAKIIAAAGGSDQNTDASDDEADAAMILPGGIAECAGLDPLSNLKLKKTALAAKCPVSGNNWECKFNITVQNFGKAYKSPIQFIDALPFGSPAGATLSFQPPAGWTCGGPVLIPNLYQCSSANPDLAHLEKVEIPVTVKIPVAPVAKCELTNNAQIVKAPGGTLLNSFAGDDASSAKAKLAPAFPQNGGEGICVQSNLKIKKTGPAEACPVSGGNWECKFKVSVQNFGSAYKGAIQFVDALPFGTPAGATISFQPPAGWSCGGPILLPNLYQCSSANPDLAHLEKVEIPLTVKIPVAPPAKCEVTNSVKIVKAPGGSAANTFAGDDTSSAKAKLAPVLPLNGGQGICLAAAMDQSEPPLVTPPGKESNLTITKTAGASQVTATGQNTTFTITVTNQGPGVFNAPIELRETLFDGAIVEPSNGSWSAPWVCEGQSALGHPEQGICKHPQIALDPGESVVLDLEMEAPNSFVAPSGSKVKCGYQNKIEILRPAGGSPKNTNAGDDVAFADVKFAAFEKHGKKFCALGLTTPPASPVCPQGWSRTPVQGKCCPPRSKWNGERCTRDVKPPEEKCPSGYAGKFPNCRKIDAPEACKSGMERINGECRCPRGMRLLDGKCRTPSSGPEKACGADEVGKYPNCRKIDCESNKQWIDGACRCRAPLNWNGKRCVADTPRTCPVDSVGNYPNCRCKRGTAGKPGDCKRIVEPPKVCPEGFRGTPPNCRRIDPPRRVCPQGFRGTPPNCERIDMPPKACPEGFRGRPPNCRPALPPRRLCPPGFRGTPPNCKRTGGNPL